jgi:hypothetical protein
LIPVVCATTLTAWCESGTAPRYRPGGLVVYVYWDDQGLSGKRVELIELHKARTTDKSGLAKFVVPPGEYTVRVYDINRGGPALQFIDTPVSITSGEEARLEIFDCLPCV